MPVFWVTQISKLNLMEPINWMHFNSGAQIAWQIPEWTKTIVIKVKIVWISIKRLWDRCQKRQLKELTAKGMKSICRLIKIIWMHKLQIKLLKIRSTNICSQLLINLWKIKSYLRINWELQSKESIILNWPKSLWINDWIILRDPWRIFRTICIGKR